MKANRIRSAMASAAVLALCAGLVCSCTQAVSAEASPLPADVNDTAYALKDIGILKGDGSDFNLDSVPDRIQSAIMVVRMTGEEQAVLDAYAAGETENPFADVTEEWALPYVAGVYGDGSVIGGAESAEGHAPCPPEEYLTLMLRALGYTDSGDSPDFTYENAKAFAAEKGIYLDSFDDEVYDRGTMASITYLTLAAKVKNSDKSLLSTLTETGAIDAHDAQGLLWTFGEIENSAGQVDMQGEVITLLTDVGRSEIIGGFRPVLGIENGDTVDTALFRRTKMIELQCNVDLVAEAVPNVYWSEYLTRSAAAEDGAYDIFIGNAADTVLAAANGLLADISQMKNVDLSQPWWNTQINAALALGTKQYMVSGDFLSPESEAQTALFYLPKTVQNLGFDDPADLVADGSWTTETMMQIAKAYDEHSGNTSLTMLSDSYLAQYLYNAAGQTMVEYDEASRFTFTADMSLAKKVHALCNTLPSVWYTDSFANLDPADNLRIGQLLFVCDSIANARQYLTAKSGLSVVPLPGRNQSQKSYASSASFDKMQVISVPAAKQSEKLGLLLSLMNSCSGNLEDAFSEQYAQNRNAEMLGLIRENTVVDPIGLSDCLDYAVRTLVTPDGDAKSVFGMYSEQIERELTAFNAAFDEQK